VKTTTAGNDTIIDRTAPLEFSVVDPRRFLMLGAGYLSFATGFVGMFLPVLPTTVFWIIAAICFAKSSPSMYRRILEWPGVGPVIDDFLRHGIISRRSKVISLMGMGVAAAIILFIGLSAVPTSLALFGIACAAIYVTTRPIS
jgi:uncharacterized membrane protein YbaN (DUF454 family)